MRTFGVEEELLLVDGSSLEPLPAGVWAMTLHEQGRETGHELTAELQQEQIEVVSAPQTTLVGQLAAIRAGRALADVAAARVGGRVVALPTAVGPVNPHLVPDRRYRRIAEHFGVTATEQLTCGFHVHVEIDSREEGVAVLDRIRVWLPVLLALSANSPFWHGVDTGYASYRYQAWSRWPTAGPVDVFGWVEAYDQYLQDVLSSGVPLDEGMLYFDARLCAQHPTVKVRVADVCLDAEHAAVLAALARALVETAAREWNAGVPPLPVRAGVLTAWMWRASHAGAEEQLIDPATGVPAPVGDVVADFLTLVRPVLAEYGEAEQVEAVVADILRDGTGARYQRETHRAGGSLRGVVARALEATHQQPAAPAQATPVPAS